MVATRTDSIDFGDAPPGGGQGLAMRGQIATSLFGDVAQPVCIGRFEVLEEIGAGGMGVVYRARDPKLDRDAAIKVMHTEQVSARGRARLIREAQTLAKLNHPHVVTVYEVAEHEQQVFVAMEFVAGGNLRDWIRDDEPSRQEILARFLDAGRGLAAAHDAGIVHRDFKPANVLLGIDGRVRVADFGLARDDGSRETRDSQSGGVSASQSDGLTKTGMVIGTPAYMAPEQWARKSITAATDQFAYCMSLWEALAGVLPYEHGVVRAAAKSGELGAPRGADAIAGRVRKALLRGLRVDAGERWPNLGALVEALEPGRAAPWKGFAVVAVVAGVVGAAAASGGEAERLHSPCAAAQARMDGTWNDSERSLARTRYQESSSFAGGSWKELEEGIQRFRGSWAASLDAVCDGNGVADSRALRCLDVSLAQFDALKQRFGEPNPEVVARLPSAVETLSDPRRCSERSYLARRPSPTEGSQVGKAVAATREMIGEAAVALSVGELRRADELLGHAEQRARTQRFTPLLAEVLLWRARTAAIRTNLTKAAELYRQSLILAQEAGHDEVVLLSVAGLLRVWAVNIRDFESLEPWLSFADATLARLLDAPRLALHLDEARLEVARHSGNGPEALRLARDLVSRTGPGATSARRRWAKRQKAHVLADSGDVAAADVLYRELLADAEARLGVQHPELASLHLALGLLYADEPSKASLHFADGLKVVSTTLGTDSGAYARHALALARAKAALGEFNEAKQLALAASVIQDSLPPESLERSGALILLAELAVAEGNQESALEYWRAVLKATEPRFDPDNYAMAVNNVGYWLRIVGRLDDSEPYYSELEQIAAAGTRLNDFARLGLVSHRLRHGRDAEAKNLLAALPYPSVDGELDEIQIETWPLWGVLYDAADSDWEQWQSQLVAMGGLEWLENEVAETRRLRK